MKNKSFRPDFNNPHQNAIVDSLWPGDRRYAYREGFKAATLTLLSAAAHEAYRDPSTGEPVHVFIDMLVYPICFNARHFIELFLKDSIRVTRALGVDAMEDEIIHTHDLSQLWCNFAAAIARDGRLEALGMPLQEVFQDIAAVDNTGMTFRYAHDLDNKPHLSGVEHINLTVLGDRLRTMFAQAEEFDVFLSCLQDEYAQKAFTEKLHRGNIEFIARRLPHYDLWATELRKVKKEICEQLNISSNDFGKALKLIKEHREFSARVGRELPLEGLPVDVFSRLARIHGGEATHDLITKEEWLRLESVMEISRLTSYSEEYDLVLACISSPNYEGRFDPEHLARNAYARNQRLREGLVKLGQPTLLAALAEAIPHLALPMKRNALSDEEISEMAANAVAFLNPASRAAKVGKEDATPDQEAPDDSVSL